SIPISRNCQDFLISQTTILTNELSQLYTCQLWHADIGNDEVGIFSLCEPESLFPILSRNDLITFQAQQQVKREPNIIIIFRYKYFNSHWSDSPKNFHPMSRCVKLVT